MKLPYLIVLFTWALGVTAHSWLDCVNVTNPLTVTNLNDMKCSGYARGYVGRSNPDANMWKIEGMSTTSSTFYNYPACRTTQKAYTSTYPMLKLKAGEKMTIAYTPNGHTTWHKPPPPNGPRDMWVKWSGVANKELLTMQEVMSAQTLLQVQFDEPCHSRVTGAELDSSAGICQADVTIPAGTPAGTYQFVWWWPFRYSGTVVEDYTTCWDVEVTASTTSASSATSTSGSASSSTSGSASGTSSSVTSGTSTTGSSSTTGTSGEIVILTRVPTAITPTSVFNVTVGYVNQGSRDIVVDILDKVNYYLFGRGVITVPAGKGSASFSIRVQNGPAYGSQYFFHAWTTGAGMVNVPDVWKQAYDEHSVDVTVGNQLVSTC